MSVLNQLKEQLYSVSHDSNQGAASLGHFGLKFGQAVQQVTALIEGSATGADDDITAALTSAKDSLSSAVVSLQLAAQKCKYYADQI